MFVPLARLIKIWKPSLVDKDTPSLSTGILGYLNAMKLFVTTEELIEVLRKGCAVMFDGIDEVYNEAPWIIESLKNLHEDFPNAQIITSSRTTGRFIETLPFLSISIMPFTDAQRESFVRNWFSEDDSKKCELVLGHLRKMRELAEITRNPLLATILCVLARHEIGLPRTEVRLYDERVRLLLGHYDLHKGIRRITTHSSYLYTLSRRLAFRLHSDNSREASRDKIHLWAYEELGHELSKGDCRRGVDELVDPCNVLVAAPGGGLTFGHLRYQEHLAAQEIASNRGIAILPLMGDEWWRGVFLLYAQITPDFSGLIKRFSSIGVIGSVRDTVEAMINSVSEDQRARLRRSVGQENFPDAGFDF